jgi:hypothetical protein
MKITESRYFKLSEFKGITPDPKLFSILHEARLLGGPISISSPNGGPRTVKEHILVYKDIYGEKWMDHITWGSRHLPRHGTEYLEAVDFSSRLQNGDIFAGAKIKEFVLQAREYVQEALGVKIPIGLGVGKRFIHLDVYRNKDAFWTYDR